MTEQSKIEKLATGFTRFQEAVFNVLNDEYDLAQEPFLELWPELERLLETHGMGSDTRTRFNDVMDKRAAEDALYTERTAEDQVSAIEEQADRG